MNEKSWQNTILIIGLLIFIAADFYCRKPINNEQFTRRVKADHARYVTARENIKASSVSEAQKGVLNAVEFLKLYNDLQASRRTSAIDASKRTE